MTVKQRGLSVGRASFCIKRTRYHDEEDCYMKELVMLVRPERLEDIKAILDEINCGGMTLSTAMGCGTQKGISDVVEEGADKSVNELNGFRTTINLLPKVKAEVVVEDRFVEPIIAKVREVCATDHVGDGKIFIRNVEDAVRIRTGERGDRAL